MYIMFSTPLTCCSMGAAMVSATTCALAPGYWQVTDTVGGAIWGNMAIGKARSASPPASVITIDRTEAKIGRSMKKRVNTVRTRESGRRKVPIISHVGCWIRNRCRRRVDERAGAGPGLWEDCFGVPAGLPAAGTAGAAAGSPMSDFPVAPAVATGEPPAESAAGRATGRVDESLSGSNGRALTRKSSLVTGFFPRRIFCMPTATTRSPGLIPWLISRNPLRSTPGVPTSTATGL